MPVDLGANAFDADHGRRVVSPRTCTSDGKRARSAARPARPPSRASSPSPRVAARRSVRALVQLTHLVPAAGGVDPKIYTRKNPKEVAKLLAKEEKRLEKPAAPGTFARGVSPRGVLAWATLNVMRRVLDADGDGAGAGSVRAETMYRVKETHTEAQLLEAASSTAHAMKNHKPVRAAVTLEVVPLGEGRVMEVTTDNAPALRSFAPRDPNDAPRNWWDETQTETETKTEMSTRTSTRATPHAWREGLTGTCTCTWTRYRSVDGETRGFACSSATTIWTSTGRARARLSSRRAASPADASANAATRGTTARV